MRKTDRRLSPEPKLSHKPALRLSRESVRTLTTDQLQLAASGCPTGSWPSDTSANKISAVC